MAARGRPKGSPNKSKQALIALLQERYPDYQPVVKMAEAAMKVTALAEAAKNDVNLWMQASEAHSRVAKYTTPQLKAVELSMNDPLVVGHLPDDPSVVDQWIQDCLNGTGPPGPPTTKD